MSLDSATHKRIQTLLNDHQVVLFMKGNPQQPMCGFSATAVNTLNELLPDYHTVNVLDDPLIREGIKAFSNWPTLPQLYVKGELLGGSDIIRQMYGSGELHQLFGLPEPERSVPNITITDKALDVIKQHVADVEDQVLHLEIGPDHNAGFRLDAAGKHDIVAHTKGLDVHLDPSSAKRAQGIVIDWVSTVQGEGLSLRFPGAQQVKSLDVQRLQQHLDKRSITLIDVRTGALRANHAALPQARILEDEGYDAFAKLPKDTPIAFICQRGHASQAIAERFTACGFTQIHNVEGGVEAWEAMYQET